METRQKVLVVDDQPANCLLIARTLQNDYDVAVVNSGQEAIQQAKADPPPDIILLDIMMPGMDGYEVCAELKATEKTKNIPVVFVTALDQMDDEARGLSLGVADYITKPVNLRILRLRVKNHLELKLYRDSLQEQVDEKTEEVRKAFETIREAHQKVKSSYIEAIYRLTLATEYKDEETGEHIRRVSWYSRELAAALGMDGEFCEAIFHASPMHDIGKVGISDSILLKQGGLTPEEWAVMKTHTTIGAAILDGSDSEYLQMAREIALYHHEKWGGKGYPFGLAGENIPLAARIMNIVDQYDALRSKRPYKPPFAHDRVVEIFTRGDGRTSPDDFDPAVLAAFLKSAGKIKEIYASYE